MPEASDDGTTQDPADVPLNRRPNPDLVSYGPAVDDSPAFTVGLWSTEALLLAAVLAGFTVLRPLGDTVKVLTAFAALLLLVAVYAVVLRGRLQGRGGPLRVVIALIVCVAFVLALVWLGRTHDAVALVATWALGQFALVTTYRARMFRPRDVSPAPRRNSR